jgi:hypothetical protein
MCEISTYTNNTVIKTVGWVRFNSMMKVVVRLMSNDVVFSLDDVLLFKSVMDHNALISIEPNFDTLGMIKDLDMHKEVNVLIIKINKQIALKSNFLFKEEFDVLVDCLNRSNVLATRNLDFPPFLFAI